jgi:uncharacterized protein YfkK (UPF0435 family)
MPDNKTKQSQNQKSNIPDFILNADTNNQNRPTYDTVTGDFSPVSTLIDSHKIGGKPYSGKGTTPDWLQSSTEFLGDAGNSVYDKNLSRQNIQDKDEFRGQNQPAVAKLGAGLVKALINTGTTAADGIIGTGLGLVELSTSGKFSKLWDNPFSNMMTDINNKAESSFPNYTTNEEKNASFIGQLGYANFWGDKFLKNLGTVAGMVIDGVVTGGASMEALGGRTLASKLPQAIANAAIKGDRALGMAIEANKGLELTKEIINNAKQLGRINTVSQGISSILSAQGMSRFMAIDNADKFYNDNYNKINQQLQFNEITKDDHDRKLEALKDAREGYGNADFLVNTVVMGLSSGIQFKNLFTKGFNPTNAIAKGITGSIDEGYTYTRPISEDILKGAKNVLAESNMFQSQYAASQAVSDFYQKKFDNKKQDKIDDVFHSVYKGLTEAYGTREGWNQGLLGGIIGLIGVPTITTKGLDWGGGIRGDLREIRERNHYNQEAVSKLNETLKSEDFKNNYQSLVRNLALEDEKNLAAVREDKYEVLNKQHDQFVNDALQFIKAGKFEDFTDNIKNIRNSNAEEVKQLFKVQSAEDNIRQFYGLKTKALENHAFEKYTSDEISRKLNESAGKMLSDAKTVKDLYDAYSTKYPGISEDAKELLVYTASKLEDVNKRIRDLNNESISKFGIDINNYVGVKDGTEVDLSEYNKEYKRVVKDQLLEGKFNPAEAEEFRKNVKDLPRLLGDKIGYTDLYKRITTNQGIIELEKSIKEEETKREESKLPYESTIDDLVQRTTDDGDSRTYKVKDIDEDGKYKLTPVDENGNPTGEEDIDADKGSLTIHTKQGKGIEEFDDTGIEPLNYDEIPDTDKKLYPKDRKNRGLKDVSTSMSHSHFDEDQNKTIVRNNEFDRHISNPSNDLKGDQINLKIDTSSDDIYKEKFWNYAKNIKDKLDKGEEFSEKEIDDIVKSRKLTRDEDNYNSLVDIIPIKGEYTTSDGELFDKGLYYHDSNFGNIFIPEEKVEQLVKDNNITYEQAKDMYVRNEKEKVRSNRIAIITAILSGKEITLKNIKKTVGIPNNTGVNRLIDEVLKDNHNNIKLGIADSTDHIFTGSDSPDMKGYGNAGNVFITTNKTCNGEEASIKTNVSKLSPEHANILWNSLLTRYHKGSGGRQALYVGDEVEGLTAGQVIDLLTTYGIGTDINHPNNIGKSHLKNKQLFVDSKFNLHYGDNIVSISDLLKGNIDRNSTREKFVDWAIKNKNYTIKKEIPELGIELNKLMTKKFKIGSWVSDGKDTYSGSLIKHGLVKTDVLEFEDTGSLFHAPVTIIDLNESGLDIKPSKAVKARVIREKQTTELQSGKKTNHPENTGTKKIEPSEKLDIKPEELEKLRSLPIGTDIYINIKSRTNEEGEFQTISKLYVSVVDNNGKKHYKIRNAGARSTFDISMDSYKDNPEPIVKVDDESITKLSKLLEENGDYSIDTSKAVEKPIVKEESKSRVKPTTEKEIEESKTKEESLLDTFTDEKGELPSDKELGLEKTEEDKNEFLNPLDYDIGEDSPFRLAYIEPTEYKVIDINKETKWLKDKLGKDIPIEIQNDLINIGKTGKKAFGQLRQDVILLSKLGAEGTAYHEAFHRVDLLYLDPIQRNDIYNEARNRFKDEFIGRPSDREVSESLAEKFREFAQEKEKNADHTILGKIGQFFQNLYHMIKNIFTGPNRLTNLDIDKLFSSIESGKFKNYKPLQDNLDKLGFGTYNLEYRDRQLDNVINYKMLKSIKKGLAALMMEPVTKKLFSEEKGKSPYDVVDVKGTIQSLDFDGLKDRIKKIVDDYTKSVDENRKHIDIIEKGNLSPELEARLKDKYQATTKTIMLERAHQWLENGQRLASLYQEVYDNYDGIYKEGILDYIYNELGIKKIDKEGEDDRVSNKEISDYDQEAYQTSFKDNIANSIKFILHNLHANNDKNPLTGMRDLVEFDEISSRIMNDCHDMNTVEDMMELLDSKKDYFPYQQLVKKLKRGSELLRTQFFTSIRKDRLNFVNVMFKESREKGELPNFSMYFTDADIQNSAKNAVNAWGELFALSNTVKDDIVDKGRLSQIYSDYDKLRKDFRNAIATKSLISIDKYKDRLINSLKSINIEVDKKTIDDLISTSMKTGKAATEEKALSNLIDQDIYNGLFSKNSTLYKYAEGDKGKGFIKLEPKTLFKDESIVRDLSRSYAKTNYQDISDNVPGADGNIYYVFSENTYTSDVIHELRNNDEFINDLKSDVYSKYSHVLGQLDDKNIRDNLLMKTFGAIIKDGSSENGRDYLNISPVEDFLFKLNLTREGYMIFPTLASRRRYPMISGLKRNELRYEKTSGGELRIPDHIVDIFYKYAQAEKNKIDKANETIKKYSTLDENGNIVKVNDFKNLVENYHYITDGKQKNISKGQAFKYQHMFESFNEKGFKFDEELVKDRIRDILKNNINETIEYAKDNNIITTDKNGKLVSQLIDKNIVNELAEQYGGDKDIAIRSILADFTVNTKISSIEAMMLFTGDISFYTPDAKYNDPADDYGKRLSVLAASGSIPRESIPVEDEDPNFNVSGLADKKVYSKYYDQIRKKHFELMLPKYGNDEKLVNLILDKNLRDYGHIDENGKLVGGFKPSDAMVLISPEMFKRDQVKRGLWDDKMKKAFNLLQSDEPITLEQEHELLGITMQPLKHVYDDRIKYDINDKDKLLIPTYDKMAMFTLHRRYIKDTWLEEVLDRMEAKGKYANLDKVHMMPYDSGVKVGNRLRTDLFKDSNAENLELNDLTNIPIYSQRFRFLRNQTNTDSHEVQKVLLASQFKKIIQSNILDENDYNVKGFDKPIKGKDLKANLSQALSKLSDKESHRLLNKLGVDENGKMDTELFYNTLLQEAKVAGMPENVQESIRKHLSLDILPERKWIFQRFASTINKHGIDLHLPGQQLIQMSGFGSGLKSKPDQSNNLKFIFDDKGNIKGTDAKISVNVFKDVIPNYNNTTYGERVKWLKSNPEVLEGIGYRIPNQGQNSSIYLNVTDFLPEESGDVIILPNEFVVLTGSDFDVDKVFFVRHNYHTDSNGKVSKLSFYTDANSTVDQRYNRMLNEAFYDNTFRFTKESYRDLEEARENYYGSLDWKNKLLGQEDRVRLSTLFDLKKELLDRYDKSSEKEKDFYHKQLMTLDSKISDVLYYNNLIKENEGLLKDYTNIIEQTLVKNKLFKSREEFKKLHEEGNLSYFDQNTKQSIQNHYLEHCKSILLSDHHFLSTSAPLGAITGKLKMLSAAVIKAEESGEVRSRDITNPVYQANQKYKFGSGTLGKGSFSLSNSAHIATQLADVSFNKDIGIGIKDSNRNTSLHEQYGLPERNGEKILISDWGSALIDAHVDIEKDPYVIGLNVVKPTYNVTQLLIRTGHGERTFEFLSQPILKELSKEYTNKDGDIDISSGRPIDIVKKKWNDQYNSLIRLSKIPGEDSRIKKELTNYKPLDDDLLKLLQVSKKDRDSLWYAKQLKILDLFNNLDKGAARDLNKLVMASRVDTKKWGNNAIEAKMFMDNIKDLYKNNPFTNLDKILPFDPETEISNDIEGGSFNAAYLRNGPLLFNKLMSDRTITATKPFNDILDKLVIKSKSQFAKNKEGLLNNMADEVHAAILSKFFSDKDYLNLDSKKVYSIMHDVSKFILDVNNNDKYREELKDNVLIQSLIKGLSFESDKDIPGFVGIPTIKSDDNFTKEDLTFAWQELLQNDDPKISNFAKQLFVYSFYTSGFKRGNYSIFHYIPPSLFEELEYNYTDQSGVRQKGILNMSEYADGLLSQLSDSNYVHGIVDGVDKEVFKNNWYNPRYVPQAKIGEVDNIKNESKTKQPLLGTIYRKNQYGYQDIIGNNKYEQPIYKPYVNYNVDENISYLMEYIGYNDLDKSPVYKVVEKRGYFNRGRVIKEYGLDHSILKRNQVIEVSDEKLIKAIKDDPNYKTFVYIPEMDREVSENKRSTEEVENNEGLEMKQNTTRVKILDGVQAVKEAEINGEGINVLRKANTNEHYGNPFSHLPSDKTNALVKVNSVKEAVDSYRDWLNGTKYQNIEPERRQWILDQINSGELDGKTLLYYKQLNEPSHADILAEVVNNRNKVTKSGFQGYKGGFENIGKGTPEGDGKDKAMRSIATTSITEVMDRTKQSSSYTTQKALPWDTNKTIDGVVMLARNSEFKGRELEIETKNRINEANERGASFIVGDMPNVDSQFIDYLDKIGAKYTIYHTGDESRIKKEIITTNHPNYLTKEKDLIKKEILESGVYDKNQIKELHDMVDKKEIKSVEDINDLIKNICAKFNNKFSIRNRG